MSDILAWRLVEVYSILVHFTVYPSPYSCKSDGTTIRYYPLDSILYCLVWLYIGGFLPDIILLTQSYLRGTRLNTIHGLCTYNLYVFCVFSSHSFWTSSSLEVPAGVTQEEGHTGFLIHLLSAVRALIFLARRIQPFLSLVDREVEFCVLTI